jgi:tetratricopeptide (TPR) repeat protein
LIRLSIGFLQSQSKLFAAAFVLLLACAHFLSASPSDPSDEMDLAIIEVPSESQAEQILKQLRAGADFAELAKAQSSDPSSKDGGHMGVVRLSDLRTELRQALQGLKPGQLTEVVKLPDGYAILKVLSNKQEPEAGGRITPAANQDSATIALAARGNVRPSPNIGGMLEAEMAFQSFNKAEGWGHDLKLICQYRKESIQKNVEALTRLLDPSNPNKDQLRTMDRIQMQYALSQLHAYQNEMPEAIEHLQAALPAAAEQYPDLVPQLVEALATAHLHAGETAADIYAHPGDRCLIPPAGDGGGKPAAQKEADEAIRIFLSYLERKPDDIEVRWLLNLAYMIAGKYPDGVPPKFLVPPSAFESHGRIGRFTDIAQQAGLQHISMAGGIIVDDFDGDGFLDIVTSSFDMCDHLHFYHNNGDGTFSDRSEQAGLLGQLGGLNIIQADYDNDGCMDVLVMRGGWEWPMRRSLLKGDCRGHFADVTRASHLEEPLAASQTAVWADLDNDGYLDLFVGNERGPAQLFHNKGDGTFEEIAHAAGVDRSSFAKSVVAADYDNDGYPDLFVSNLYADNFLYHNNGNLTFTEVGADAGVQKPLASFASWFFDYDNDGWPDLFVTSYYMSTEESARSRLGMPVSAETLKLYHNSGHGKFQDVTEEVGLNRVFMPMGGNFGDADNDGWLDLYMGSGSPSFVGLVPYVLFKNESGKSFSDVTAAAGVGELHKGHGVAFADLGNNGQEDIITVVGGAVASDAHAMRLFVNPGNENDWISIHLVGQKSNRAAIGARITLEVENEGHAKRQIARTVSSGGSFGASPLRQHIGLGKGARITGLTIDWPTSKTRQRFSKVAVNQFIEIREFDKRYASLKPRSFHFHIPKQ